MCPLKQTDYIWSKIGHFLVRASEAAQQLLSFLYNV